MGISAQEVPTRSHESKYEFPAADVKAAAKLLGEGQNPGNGGYEKEGHARSAAAHLIEQVTQLGEAPGQLAGKLDEVGSRCWKDSEGKWAFALKIGKRKANGKK